MAAIVAVYRIGLLEIISQCVKSDVSVPICSRLDRFNCITAEDNRDHLSYAAYSTAVQPERVLF